MFFFPFRVDLNFNRFPLLTILVCLVCIYVFIQQGVSSENIVAATKSFCEKKHDRIFWIVIKKVSMVNNSESTKNGRKINELFENECNDVFYNIHTSKHPDAVIDKYIERLDANAIRKDAINIIHIRGMLEEKLREFRLSGAEQDLTTQIMYEPHSYNLKNMITAAFAHADWDHLLGNLFFFFAFAASIEMILGMLRYVFIFSSLAVGTHLAYSLVMVNINEAAATLGLSGVVMGMIGVFVYLMPKVNIRCFLWLIVFFKVVRIPAWLLAVVYIGWDIYSLVFSDAQSGTNFVVHIAGATLGFSLGLIFLTERKEELMEEMRIYQETEKKRLNNKE